MSLGQLGVLSADRVLEDASFQAKLHFESIGQLLLDPGTKFADLIGVNAFVAGLVYLRAYIAAQDRIVKTPSQASTQKIASGFAREIFRVEVEIATAKKFSK